MVRSNLHRYLVVAAALLAVASCDDPMGVEPAAPALQRVEAPRASLREFVAFGDVVKRSNSLEADVSVTGTITPGGGVLALPEAGLLLYVPEGAVAEPVQITATALQGNRVVYDFQPHGLVFATPVYVAQLLVGTELNSPRARKKRPEVWAGYLAEGTADVMSNGIALFTETFDAFYHGSGSETVVVFSTTHFSGYAMASGRRESSSGSF